MNHSTQCQGYGKCIIETDSPVLLIHNWTTTDNCMNATQLEKNLSTSRTKSHAPCSLLITNTQSHPNVYSEAKTRVDRNERIFRSRLNRIAVIHPQSRNSFKKLHFEFSTEEYRNENGSVDIFVLSEFIQLYV